jgi:hypothetical protein
MRTSLIRCVLASVALLGIGPSGADAQYINPYGRESPTEGLLSGRAAMGNAAAAVVNSQAAMAKAVGDAATSNVKALENLETARGRVIENSVKSASTFYEKRKLFAAHQGSSAVQRASRDDLLRYGKAGLSTARIDAQGKVDWPELLLRGEFSVARAAIDYAFSQRSLQPMDVGSDPQRTARTAVGQMRSQLRKLMSELSPAEYAAARRFLDSLTLELQLGPRVETMLKTAVVPPPSGSKVAAGK